MKKLYEYLQENGILLCNMNPYLPSLETIGCSWVDVTEEIDNHRLFYSKVYKKRTTYLSVEAYYLLKTIRKKKTLTESAKKIYNCLINNPFLETKELKMISSLPTKEYSKGFDFLLQNMYITAMQNGKELNSRWSTFFYGTPSNWEKYNKDIYNKTIAEERLWELFGKNMKKNDFKAIIGI